MSDYLLDTHVFIWWQVGDPRLGRFTRASIADPSGRVFVSAASVWEIAIKKLLGKLAFDASPTAAILRNGFFELPIVGSDAEWAGGLDWDHVDPFDRLLVAQAIRNSMVLVTADAEVAAYNVVPQLWAAS